MSDDVTVEVVTTMRRLWWLPVLRGVVLLVLGLLMLAHPLETPKALVWVWGVFAVVDGLLAIAHWVANRDETGSGWWAVAGLVGIVLGVVAIAWPGPTVTVIFYLISGWILVLGVIGIIGSVVLYRKHDLGWYWVLTLGLVSFLIGLLLITNPQTSLTIVMVLLGLFAFVSGVVLVVSGFATRSFAKQIEQGSAAV